MNDDNDSPWDDKNPFDKFRDFEEFMEIFKEFIETPLAKQLMQQIFENFRYLSKNENSPEGFPEDFNFNRLFKQIFENSEFIRFSPPSPSERKKTPSFASKKKEEYKPTSTLYEEGDKVRVVVDLPGVSQDQLNVDVKEKQVKIRGENEEKIVHKKIDLKDKVNPENVDFRWNNGVLELLLEKAREEEDKELFYS